MTVSASLLAVVLPFALLVGSGQAATEMAPSVGQTPDASPLATYRLSGGVAGFDEQVVAYSDGTVRVRDHQASRVRRLRPEDLDRLTSLVQRLEDFTTGSSGLPGTTDQMGSTTTFNGTGAQQATDAEKQSITAFLEKLGTDASATLPLGEAGEDHRRGWRLPAYRLREYQQG
jgi:hypothetical protein